LTILSLLLIDILKQFGHCGDLGDRKLWT